MELYIIVNFISLALLVVMTCYGKARLLPYMRPLCSDADVDKQDAMYYEETLVMQTQNNCCFM